ncbi:aldehyde dehydrogenase family protein [Alicyclobacillus mali (ex Roth et al. 2021)]|uniref:aldehyde dehydrogenase family protein n=1 Tax=Alicyclobacillus mali (ex Roth et al. 2021) TaxID=1123961 RepID=UPI001A8D3C32|nr:aldehyde dehydrogenase family protein [Alicyclobacillus mali (ex Roth et al. 2021)]
MFVDGRFVESDNAETRELFDPATGHAFGRVVEAQPADLHAAIRVARKVFDESGWPWLSARERARLLLRIAAKVEELGETFARLETLQTGKPLRESRLDVEDSVQCFRYYAGLIMQPNGMVLSVPEPIHSYTFRQPIGVCGLIVPWNFPLLIASWKLAPALATGNTCILKPSEWTPVTALLLAKVMHEAGLPPGVVSVVPGAGDPIGQGLVEHPDVNRISFTGGTTTGRKIIQAAAPNITRVSVELGGKSAVIVFDDADWQCAVDHALFAIYYGAGQVCAAGSRLLLESSIYDRFLSELKTKAEHIRVGDGFDESVEMGPLVSETHMRRVLQFIKNGCEEGAQLVTGGKRVTSSPVAHGYFVQPTIFAGVTSDMSIVREEIFGPVLTVQPFVDEEDAIRMANASQYGLAAGVFTRDVARVHRVIRRLQTGITWVNTYHTAYVEAPWGGLKRSGIGRELGIEALHEYTETRQVQISTVYGKSGFYPM